MKLRQKILLLAVAPLTIAMLAIMLTVRHQSIALAKHERQLVESAYLQAKETELRAYVKLAQSAIAPLLASGKNDDATRDEAMRGIRVSLAYPELFRTQLHAMLRAAPHGDLHIMFPMVSSLDEVLAAKRMVREAQERYPHPVKIGLMIEVPAAVAMAEALAKEVDFFSIGTNDLAQYTLAIDRGHAKLAAQVDALHPAVLKMIEMTVAGAHAHGKWVGVCGAMASDPAATAILVGLGIDELSVSVPAIAAIKAELASLDFEACRTLAQRVIKLGSAAQVRQAIAAGQ